MVKLRFEESTLYIIRSYYEETNVMFYYQSPTDWCNHPSMATIFRDYDIAEVHKQASYAADPEEGLLYEVVSLKNELLLTAKEKKGT